MLINIEQLMKFAESKGFRIDGIGTSNVNNAIDYVELYDNRHPEGFWHNGCQYANPDFVINDDRPCTWPFKSEHPGMTRSDACGTSALLAHPAMSDYRPS